MYDFKDDLIGGAYMIESETAGFLSAAGYMTKIIERGIAPLGRPGDSELIDFLPIVVSVDVSNTPSELPDHTAKLEPGAVACLPDRAIFAWMTGRIFLKVHTYTLDYNHVTKTTPIAWGEARGIDIFERTTWTVMFGEQIATEIVEAWRERLNACLTGEALS